MTIGDLGDHVGLPLARHRTPSASAARRRRPGSGRASRCRPSAALAVRSRVAAPDQRHEHRDQRQREHARSRPRSSRWRPARSRPRAARSRASSDLGEVPGEVVVERVDPARRERRQRAGALRADPRTGRARPPVAAARRAAGSWPAPRPGRPRSSAPHATAARASTTTSSATIGPRSCDSPLPEKAWATTLASSQACTITSSAATVPSPTEAAMNASGGAGVAQQAWVDGASTRPLTPRPFLPHGRSPPARGRRSHHADRVRNSPAALRDRARAAHP